MAHTASACRADVGADSGTVRSLLAGVLAAARVDVRRVTGACADTTDPASDQVTRVVAFVDATTRPRDDDNDNNNNNNNNDSL